MMAESTVGPYVLECHLARGGMGDVWRAHRQGPGGFRRKVALKKILPYLVRDDSQVQQFLREARLGSWLQHPNAVGVIDVGFEATSPFLVMDLVEGVDLRRLAQRGTLQGQPIPPALAGYVVHQVLLALEAARGLTDPEGYPAPLVHRDISPENVLVSWHGEVRVADFGLAKQLRDRDHITDAGMVKGKVCYMSPEQLTGQPLDERSDLFSVGVLFHELLCGQLPFLAQDPITALDLCRQPSPHPLELKPDLPRGLADLAHRWRRPWPDERAPSVAHARHALEEVLASELHGLPARQLASYTAWVALDRHETGMVTASREWRARMPCAKCGGTLQALAYSNGVIADVCPDCEGVWLDAHEILRILGERALATRDELDAPAEPAALDAVIGDCPRCRVRMKATGAPAPHRFSLERCPRCRGMWFDAGELEQVAHGDAATAVRFLGGFTV